MRDELDIFIPFTDNKGPVTRFNLNRWNTEKFKSNFYNMERKIVNVTLESTTCKPDTNTCSNSSVIKTSIIKMKNSAVDSSNNANSNSISCNDVNNSCVTNSNNNSNIK